MSQGLSHTDYADVCKILENELEDADYLAVIDNIMKLNELRKTNPNFRVEDMDCYKEEETKEVKQEETNESPNANDIKDLPDTCKPNKNDDALGQFVQWLNNFTHQMSLLTDAQLVEQPKKYSRNQLLKIRIQDANIARKGCKQHKLEEPECISKILGPIPVKQKKIKVELKKDVEKKD